ncbi:MAG: DNA ligase D [Chloroflexi bacterium]|nr:DNA ligase D [Chloroflexota bacterium]
MLDAYRRKRDFAQTPEPTPEPREQDEGPLTFVIQKHAARRLHYDFRLELDGALKSWSVPKGPSLNPKDKRLAVMVEDHPLDYASFEGVIPRGQYGGGQVIVWDNGTYSPDEDGKLSFHDRREASERLRRGLAEGKLSIFLRGHKLKGSWTLVRTKTDWLLIKHQDEFADDSRDILAEDRSIISGVTIDDLRAGRLPRPTSPGVEGRGSGVAGVPGARKAPFPEKIAPMLASLAEGPFSNADWLFEPKLDGVRAIALIREGKVTLLSRRGLDATAQHPSLAEDLARQPDREVILDGEIVALDENGIPSFQLLQQRLNLTRPPDIRKAESQIPVLYYVFDLLYLNGYDLRGVTAERRRALLDQTLVPSERVKFVEEFGVDGEAAYQIALEHGLEGVVAKRRDSVYESGKRSRLWLKAKATQSDEFVVGGYSRGQGSRFSTFGALLLGYYEDGRLTYAGHVGSGFSDRMLEDLRKRLDGMRTDDCPFAEPPPVKDVTWVRPGLVVEVRYVQRTADNRLRAPVFMRLREDKPAGEVRPSPAVAPPRSEGPSDQGRGLEDAVAEVLEQLEGPKEEFTLSVQGHRLKVSNLDKAFWPALEGRRALTKRDLLVYLAKAAPCALPHLKDRPLTLTRYPDGIHGESFYQKHWDNPLPKFVETVRLYSSHNEGDVEYLMINNFPTLLWLGQLADIELHTWYSRVNREPDARQLTTRFAGSEKDIDGSVLNYPDFIVFDLDPYIYSGREGKGDEPELNRKAFAKTCEIALRLKELLDALSLSSFIKTSGKTGLHIYVPILRQLDYDTVRSASETIGRFLLRQHPGEITMEWTVSKRIGKVFLDHNQNARGKTLASVYSPRPAPEATVSMPLRWDELEKVYPADFTIVNAPERLAEVGDLWAGILDAKQDLKALLAKAEGGDKPS